MRGSEPHTREPRPPTCETHSSAIEVSGTTTAEPSRARVESSTAGPTASAAATEVATSTESAASKSAPAAAGRCRIAERD